MVLVEIIFGHSFRFFIRCYFCCHTLLANEIGHTCTKHVQNILYVLLVVVLICFNDFGIIDCCTVIIEKFHICFYSTDYKNSQIKTVLFEMEIGNRMTTKATQSIATDIARENELNSKLGTIVTDNDHITLILFTVFKCC